MRGEREPTLDGSSLPQVVGAGLSRVDEGALLPEHRLGHPEIDLCGGGRIEATLNGEPQIVEAGMATSYRVGDVYRARVARGYGPLICRWVSFAWPAGRGAQAITLRRRRRLEPTPVQAMTAAFDRLLAARAQAAPGWRIAVAGALLEIVAGAAGDDLAATPALDPRLVAGLDYLERHHMRALKIAEAAAASGLTEDYFTRLFRRELGLPPMQHLIRLRLREARRLLGGEARLAVTEVARRCGFEDAGHFARLFRRHFGDSPRSFRSRLEP